MVGGENGGEWVNARENGAKVWLLWRIGAKGWLVGRLGVKGWLLGRMGAKVRLLGGMGFGDYLSAISTDSLSLLLADSYLVDGIPFHVRTSRLAI